MKDKCNLWFDVFLISIARKILSGRNVGRCRVVSRRDNNNMAYMAEQLENIEIRMKNKYT